MGLFRFEGFIGSSKVQGLIWYGIAVLENL